MNRKEAIKIVKKSNIYGARMNGKNLIIEAINELVKDITLSDLLGWEEGVEYEDEETRCKIENGVLYYFSNFYDSWMTTSFGWTDKKIQELQQAKKVEKKQKAYHVTDEYSLECLVQELQDQGFKYKSLTLEEHMEIKKEMLSRNGVTYIYVDEDTGINGFDKHYSLIDEFEIIEYHKEEPKFYAKIKGWELTSDFSIYWNYDLKTKEVMVHSNNHCYFVHTKMTKTEWNELGINDSNADFEEIEGN